MSKTTLWHVALRGRKVIVSKKAIPAPFNDYMRIRTISANAAGRKYVRDNLPTRLHEMQDGMNEPDDLVTPSPHNGYAPRQERRIAKRAAKLLRPQICRV